MLADTNERAGIEEQYQRASNASDLSVEPERRGSADMMIAAGWSSSRVGMALLRLHSEWDASEKPPRPTKEAVKALTGTFQRALPGEELKPGSKAVPLTAGQAHHYAAAWHAHEVGMLLQKLKALPAVREQVASQAMKWGMGLSSDPITRSDRSERRQIDAAHLQSLRAAAQAEPNDATLAARIARQQELMEAARAIEHAEDMARATEKAAAVVRYWLDQTCRSCGGLKWQLVAGAPSLSNKPCRACGGSGIAPVPHQQDGRRLANWMDSCVEDARGSVKVNLAHWRRARNKVVDTPNGRAIIAAEDRKGR
jgi:hypothetical protein